MSLKTRNETFIRELNNALAQGDIEYIIARLADDIHWEIVGGAVITGKDAFLAAIQGMEGVETLEMKLHSVFASGEEGVVHGTMLLEMPDGTQVLYSFCDVYQLTRDDPPLLKSLISYVVHPEGKGLKDIVD